ncbi:hypothetical protein [Rheinheimera sp.]|uniref:hypothetical protein n=1 Tax=Rheinheimera TaxID=67575 RepID=UPI0037C6D9F2
MALDTLVPLLKAKSGFDLFAEQVKLYQSIQFPNCTEADDDMLLFQWGTFDWGEGKFFELDLTRQLTDKEANGDVVQLCCTLKFQSNSATDYLGEGNFWCNDKNNSGRFLANVVAHTAFQKCLSQRIVATKIEVECV